MMDSEGSTVTIKFTVRDGYLVSDDGYRLAYAGVLPFWQVKPEDFEHLLVERKG